MLGNFACFFVICGFFCCCFFWKVTFSKKPFKSTIRASNSLDPDQARYFVDPDLDPNCLQRLSADDKVATSGERVKKSHFGTNLSGGYNFKGGHFVKIVFPPFQKGSTLM